MLRKGGGVEKKRNRAGTAFLALVILVMIAIILMTIPFLFNFFYLKLPEYSLNYDCDDAVLQTVDKLSALGINATPVLGSLTMTGEKWHESDHAWVVVKLPFNRFLAIDWGMPEFGRQYYEYYEISREQLVEFVKQDYSNQEIPAGK